MTTHWIHTDDGARIHVEEAGSGPPVVLVNGAFCTLRQWDRVAELMAPSHRVVRHDVRGSGRSGAGPDDGWSFERYADDIACVCDRLGLERAAIWGMAWGARVALVAAVRHAELFDRLVLSDLGITPADVEAQKAGAVAAAEARLGAGIAEVEKPAGWRDHEDFDAAKKAMRATFAHPDLMPFVEAVRMPTLIVTGEHDPNLASSRRSLTGLADGRLEVLEHTGHGSVLQRPDRVVEVVAPFISLG